MLKKISMLLFIITSFSFGNPSFDCSKATSTIEENICKNIELSKLDMELSLLYKQLKEEDEFKSIKASQREWILKRNDCQDSLNTTECLFESYKNRINELKKIDKNSKLLNGLIGEIARDIKDERELLSTKNTSIKSCIKPDDLDTINNKTISIEEQRKVLFDYTDKWNTYINCQTKMIYENSTNVEELYELVRDEIECNPGFNYVFNNWSSSLISLRSMYVVAANCNQIDINRSLFFIQQTLPKQDITQQKWEEYFTSITGVKNINNLDFLSNLHPYNRSELTLEISKLLKNRIEDIYSHLCEKEPLEIHCSERRLNNR